MGGLNPQTPPVASPLKQIEMGIQHLVQPGIVVLELLLHFQRLIKRPVYVQHMCFYTQCHPMPQMMETVDILVDSMLSRGVR
jgi:hypothetical protein